MCVRLRVLLCVLRVYLCACVMWGFFLYFKFVCMFMFVFCLFGCCCFFVCFFEGFVLKIPEFEEVSFLTPCFVT